MITYFYEYWKDGLLFASVCFNGLFMWRLLGHKLAAMSMIELSWRVYKKHYGSDKKAFEKYWVDGMESVREDTVEKFLQRWWPKVKK